MAKNFSVAWLSQSSHEVPRAVQQENGSCLEAVISGTLTTFVDPPNQTKRTSAKVDLGIDDVGCNAKPLKAPSSPTNSCGYTSESESEVCEDSERESGSNRRIRTKFTTYQISRLEKTFNKHKYLGASQRRKIAEKLHLSETQVKTWFQNRRMKLKREVQDTQAEYLAPALLAQMAFPPPSFQHHTLSGQRHALPSGAFPFYPPSFHARVSVPHIPHQHVTHPALLASCYY